MKNGFKQITDAVNRIFNPKVISILLGVCFILTLLPILYVAPAVRATGDDLGYSYTIHNAIVNGAGFAGIISAIAQKVVNSWNTWQGTWSSIVLFCLQPGIWGEEWYPLTVLTALVSIIGGSGYFLHTFLKRCGFSAEFRWIIFFLTEGMIIQYMPYVRGGIFWWTSVAHYSIPFGIVMMCMGWSLRWIDTGMVRFFVGILLGMTYLGGAGYPSLVLGAVWMFLLIVRGLMDQGKRKRSLLLLIPLILEMIGFVISAVAPGNSVRGGDGFGFSVSNIIYTLEQCVIQGIRADAGYFLEARALLPVLAVIAFFAWELYEPNDKMSADKPWQPFLAIFVGMGISCIVRAPEIYAATEVSGGVSDTYWFVAVVAFAICTAYVSAWLRGWTKAGTRKENRISSGTESHYSSVFFLAVLLLCLLLNRHLIGGTVDYTCIQFVVSGAFEDYRDQMGEWLAILNDPEIVNAELPAMNDEQGPFMLMVPLEETGSFTNSVYENYYGKESVVSVPRE